MIIPDLIFLEQITEVSHGIYGGESIMITAVNGQVVEQDITGFQKTVTTEGPNTVYNYQSATSSIVLSLPNDQNAQSVSSSVIMSTSSI